jgi:hypothetical protein
VQLSGLRTASRFSLFGLIVACAVSIPASGQLGSSSPTTSITTEPTERAPTPASGQLGAPPRIFVAPQDGFESYISAAIIKKHVPAVVTQDQNQAEFLLTSAVLAKEESTGSKVARCLFAYCAGIQGTQTATVQLVNARTHEVAWAYNVRKASATAFQSSAEAIAKHLKQYLAEHPQ